MEEGKVFQVLQELSQRTELGMQLAGRAVKVGWGPSDEPCSPSGHCSGREGTTSKLFSPGKCWESPYKGRSLVVLHLLD